MDGSPSDEYIINAEFVAMLDYHVATSLSAKTSGAERFRPYYRQHVGIYKAFDGKTACRAVWRPQLLAVLKDWQARFSGVARKKKNRLSGRFAATAVSEDPGVTQDDL